MGSCPRVCFHSFFFYLVPPRKGSALSLLVPLLHPDARAHGPVGLLEELAVLGLLALLGGALVELVVPRVAVAGLVGCREPRIVRSGSQLDFDLGLLLLLDGSDGLLLLWGLDLDDRLLLAVHGHGASHLVSSSRSPTNALS